MYVRLTIHESIIARIISVRVLRSKDKAAGEKLTELLRAIINQSVITSGSLCERALGRDGVHLRRQASVRAFIHIGSIASRPNCLHFVYLANPWGGRHHVQVQRQRGVRRGKPSGGHAHRLQQQRARRRSSQQQQRAEYGERQSQQCSRHHQRREDRQSRG